MIFISACIGGCPNLLNSAFRNPQNPKSEISQGFRNSQFEIRNV